MGQNSWIRELRGWYRWREPAARPGTHAVLLVAAAERTSSRTQSLLALATAGILVAAIYRQIVPGMAADWAADPNYSHGFLVPAVSLWLVWRRRERLRRIGLDGSWLGLPVLAGGVAMLLLGTIAAEDFLARSSLLVVLAGMVLLHGGRDLLREMAFPIGFLVFMVPLPFLVFNAVAFPLQSLAARNAETILLALGVPVLRDGNVIHLSHVTLGVTEACSGIRSLISLAALAVVWAYLAIPGVVPRALFVAITVPITIAANAARVVLTGLLGQWLGVEWARGFFHAFSGSGIFLVAFAGLLAAHFAIREAARPRGRSRT